jgi:hypothetical protein
MEYVTTKLVYVLVIKIILDQIVLNYYCNVQIIVQVMVFVIHQLDFVLVIKIILDLIALN